jgi:hypothetical protein
MPAENWVGLSMAPDAGSLGRSRFCASSASTRTGHQRGQFC